MIHNYLFYANVTLNIQTSKFLHKKILRINPGLKPKLPKRNEKNFTFQIYNKIK